ncbi:MAG: dinitrogenase iron-molybdenum cofactor biosynthesis protein [Lachnospiraceae bacterium]|nr:dinitrogenase iron-molybdenum cofactor biosynthesis protein [Lachnospiraceae bacterium]
MRITVADTQGNVADFKDAESFLLFDVENGTVTLGQSVTVRKDWYMSAPEFLAEEEVDAVICAGMGRGARSSFKEAGIEVYAGVSGGSKEAVEAFMDGSLSFDPLAGMI